MRRLIVLAASALLTAPAPALSQSSSPFTVEDLLQQEGLGAVRISPNGRWIVMERQAPWGRGATYRLGYNTPLLLTGLEIRSVDDAAIAYRLSDPGHANGYVAGPFSPSGDRMVVYRLTESSWRLGVMALETGDVQWLGVTPDAPRLGRTLAWRSETQLVLIARPDDDLPYAYRVSFQTQDRAAELWRNAAAGHLPSAVFIPSGSARDSRDHAEGSRLLTIDLPSGRERVIATGELFDFELSPDGRTIAALLDSEDFQPSVAEPILTGNPTRRRRLILADIDDPAPIEPLPDKDFASHLLTWSTNSARLLVFSRSVGTPFSDGDFWTIERDGDARKLDLGTARPWIDTSIQGIPIALGSWGESGPIVQVEQSDGSRAWKHAGDPNGAAVPVAEGRETLASVAGQLWIERRAGLVPFEANARSPLRVGRLWDAGQGADGGNRQMTNPDAVERGRGVLMDDQACLSAPDQSVLRRCVTPLAPGETIVAVSPRRDLMIGRLRSPTGSEELRAHSTDGVETLLTINQHLDTRDWGRVERIDHLGPDGQALASWLLLPPGVQDGDPPALVILAYPGVSYPAAPAWLEPGSRRRHINPALLAAAGYAVLVPSLPHRTGPTPDLSDLASRIGGIVDLVIERDLVDPDRHGLIGHSYGGYGALLVATQSDRFDAIVASNGYADLSRVMELPAPWRVSTLDGVPINQFTGWSERGQGGVGASFPQASALYAEKSPIYAASQIRTPILLIETDLDGARLGSMFGALYRMNHEAGLLTYFGEGHELMSPANIRDLHTRILAWLGRYLGAPDAADPRLPMPNPDLEHRVDQETVAGRTPDEPLLR